VLIVFLLIAAVLFLLLARVFRRTLASLDKPTFVMEKPPMPKDLAAAMARIDKWRAEGRISREDHERLTQLCREDASASR
jgi:hypothetical protein